MSGKTDLPRSRGKPGLKPRFGDLRFSNSFYRSAVAGSCSEQTDNRRMRIGCANVGSSPDGRRSKNRCWPSGIEIRQAVGQRVNNGRAHRASSTSFAHHLLDDLVTCARHTCAFSTSFTGMVEMRRAYIESVPAGLWESLVEVRSPYDAQVEELCC